MITDTAKYKWELCFTDGSNGHSLWLDRNSAEYSIKDQSGKRPDSTDDGVLWFQKNGLASVHTSKFHKDGLCVAFSVESQRHGSKSTVSCVFDFGIKIAKALNMTITLDSDLKKLEPLFRTPNSTLTDAAPDLLNACVKMCEYGYLSNWPESMLKEGREAIGKARGIVQ